MMADIDRLKSDLIETGKIGRSSAKRIEEFNQLDPQDGITRPTGTQADKEIRNYAVDCMNAAGLNVQIDEIGNIFGRKEGSKPNAGTVMFGSHLDSVINGGMFDGALGVFSAIEAVRVLNEEGFDNRRPLEVVIFSGEEGSAFKQVLLGSSVLTGKMSIEDAYKLENENSISLTEALENIGYRGSARRNLDDVEYMLELHVEQGPVLDAQKVPIGIVENITGLAWIMATITGTANHAGTTPMKMRKDALVAASEIITFVNGRANEMVEKLGASTVGTVGKLNVFPNGTNIVPGKVEMGIDIRDVEQQNMDQLINETLAVFKNLEKKYGVKTSTELPIMLIPAPLSSAVVNMIEKSAEEVGIVSIRMNSGAGHDAQNMAEKVKTGMIFVPSVNGISHSPMEWTNWDDIEKGVQVMTQTIKNLSS
jgi:N-carbamoyl-L-amino-acid hydrolase